MQAESTHRVTKLTTRNRYMVVLVMFTFFVISLLTNIVGPLVPDIISSFQVTLTAAAFLAFSFFIAYAVMSIPAGFLLERLREKPVMIMAFLAGMLGSLSFALFPHYDIAIVSYFVMGAGMAVLQVAINPLLRISGGEEHYAFYSALAQFVFGAASFLSPRIYSYLVLNLGKPGEPGNLLLRVLGRVTPRALPWASIYWIFAVSTLLMVVLLGLSKFPAVRYTAEETVGSWEMYLGLARKKVVWMYFISMFAYVGCEQGTADWISKFLSQYHGFDPHTTGAAAVSWFWGLMTAGCLVGMLLLKIFDSRRVPDRRLDRSIALPICGVVRAGPHFVPGISRDRSVRLSHVADHNFAGAQFGGRASRLICRNPGNGNGDWRSRCTRHRGTHRG